MGRHAQARKRGSHSDTAPGLPVPPPQPYDWELAYDHEEDTIFLTVPQDPHVPPAAACEYDLTRDGDPVDTGTSIPYGTTPVQIVGPDAGLYVARVRFVDVVGQGVSDWSAQKQFTYPPP
jgi:hypothetical protein